MSEFTIAPTTSATSTASATAATQLTSDFNTFLQLLTAQVTNQDPLSPLDSTQFVEQLATFSALEQQVTTNAHLESIVEVLQTQFGEESSTLLGQTIIADSITLTEGDFTERAIVTTEDVTGALVVRDSDGGIVYKGDQNSQWSWDGTKTNGTAAPAGTYTFEIDTDGGTVEAYLLGNVTEVAESDDGYTLSMGDGITTDSYAIVEA